VSESRLLAASYMRACALYLHTHTHTRIHTHTYTHSHYSLQQTTTLFSTPQHPTVHCNKYIATYCTTLQHTARHCTLHRRDKWLGGFTLCNILQNTTTNCNKLQQTAIHCNTLLAQTTHKKVPARILGDYGWSLLDYQWSVNVLQCVAVCCSVCNVLQCVAVSNIHFFQHSCAKLSWGCIAESL